METAKDRVREGQRPLPSDLQDLINAFMNIVFES